MANLDLNAFFIQILIHLSIVVFLIVSKTIKTALLLSYISFILCSMYILTNYNFTIYQSTTVIVGVLLVVIFTIFMERGSNKLLRLFKYL